MLALAITLALARCPGELWPGWTKWTPLVSPWAVKTYGVPNATFSPRSIDTYVPMLHSILTWSQTTHSKPQECGEFAGVLHVLCARAATTVRLCERNVELYRNATNRGPDNTVRCVCDPLPTSCEEAEDSRGARYAKRADGRAQQTGNRRVCRMMRTDVSAVDDPVPECIDARKSYEATRGPPTNCARPGYEQYPVRCDGVDYCRNWGSLALIQLMC